METMSFRMGIPLEFCMGTGKMLQLGVPDPHTDQNVILSISNPVIEHIEMHQGYVEHYNRGRLGGPDMKIADGPMRVMVELSSYNAKAEVGAFDFTDPILNRSISDLLAAIQVKLARGESG